ncbi:MAG TPA: flagellar biosynthesis protein FlhF, partial [Rhodanobacter sp.]
MKIKRFVAPDMRQAMREVREEQGPDAVILSTRRMDDGIEVIAAIDYDEALVREAARHGAPAAPPTAPEPKEAKEPKAGPMPVAAAAQASTPVASAKPSPSVPPPPAPRRLHTVV